MIFEPLLVSIVIIWLWR